MAERPQSFMILCHGLYRKYYGMTLQWTAAAYHITHNPSLFYGSLMRCGLYVEITPVLGVMH